MADDETLRMVTAFIAGVSATMAVVGSLISWRNYKRARDIDGTRLFWDLRKDAISEQHREYMAETARLLLQYDLKSKDIPSTPEISRLLNHLDWVGYFVKKHVISMEEASSTFGNDILHLYPALFDYICKQRQDRGYRSLWDKVDYLVGTGFFP